MGRMGRAREDFQADAESDIELDKLADKDSDSDDNHSNQDTASAQCSVQTGPDTGVVLATYSFFNNCIDCEFLHLTLLIKTFCWMTRMARRMPRRDHFHLFPVDTLW